MADVHADFANRRGSQTSQDDALTRLRDHVEVDVDAGCSFFCRCTGLGPQGSGGSNAKTCSRHLPTLAGGDDYLSKKLKPKCLGLLHQGNINLVLMRARTSGLLGWPDIRVPATLPA